MKLKIVFRILSIFILLASCTIQGKKAWDPFEAAGDFIAKTGKEIGKGLAKTEKDISTGKTFKDIGKGFQDIGKGIGKGFERDTSLFRNFKVENKSGHDLDVLVQWFKPSEGVECYPYYCGGDAVWDGDTHDFLCGEKTIKKGSSYTFKVPYKEAYTVWVGAPCFGIPSMGKPKADSSIEKELVVWIRKAGSGKGYSFEGYVPDSLVLGGTGMLVSHNFINCSASPQQVSLRAPLAINEALDVLTDIAKVGMFFAGFISMKLLPVQMIVSPMLQSEHQSYVMVSAILYPGEEIVLGFPEGLAMPIRADQVQFKVDSGGQYAESYEGWQPEQNSLKNFSGIGNGEVIEITSQAETVCNCPYEYSFPQTNQEIDDYKTLRSCTQAQAQKPTVETDLQEAKKGKDTAKIKQLEKQLSDLTDQIDGAACKSVANKKFICLSPNIPGLPENVKQEYKQYEGDENNNFCCSTIQDSSGLCVNNNANIGNTYYFMSNRLKSMEYKSCTTTFQAT